MFCGARTNLLITGASSGIGRELVERFLAVGTKVLVTGRDEDKLMAMTQAHPGLLTFRSDAGRPDDRETLAQHVRDVMPELNVVINNAGIQRRVGLAEDVAPWPDRQAELDILLAGPIHLNALLLPTMLDGKRSGLIVNVTSGGGYIPQPFAPVYAACKAALHSYTVTLRHALGNTPVEVVELIPPAVATGLAGPGNHHGTPLEDFCDAVFPQIVRGDRMEIGYGPTTSDDFRKAQEPYRAMFEAFAARSPTAAYAAR